MQLRQWDKVVADYTRAIELKPDEPSCYERRGTAYLQLTQYDKAIADYSKAIELDPKNDYYRQQRMRAQQKRN